MDTLIESKREAAAPARAWLQELRALAKLAGPLIVTQLMQMIIMTTDLIMLGRVGKEAIAAAALGNTVFIFTWLMSMGPAAAVSPMIAHILGANPNDHANVRAVTRMGFWATWLLCLPLACVLLATEPILLAFGQVPALAHSAATFTLPLCLGLFFTSGFQVLRSHATALGQPNAPLIVMVAAVFFNALAGYALIFGHFGLPRLEVVGSGIATTISLGFSLLAMLAIIQLRPRLKRYRVFRRFTRPDWPKFAELLALGLPIGLTVVFENMLFNASMLVMGLFGTDYVAAHQVAINVPSLTFMVPLGIGLAATVRVGLSAGANDRAGARRAGYVAMLAGTCFMALCGVVIALFPRAIAELYFGSGAGDAALVSLTVNFLYVAAAFQVFDALQVVAALALRGLKDAGAPMLLAGVSYWLVGAPVGLFLAFVLGMRGMGVWFGLATALAAAAGTMSCRFWYLTRREESFAPP